MVCAALSVKHRPTTTRTLPVPYVTRVSDRVSKAHGECRQLVCRCIFVIRPREATHQDIHHLQHPVVVPFSALCCLTWRECPKKVMATRPGTLREDLPRTLEIWDPRDGLPESALVFLLDGAVHELWRPDRSAQDFDARWVPNFLAQIDHIRGHVPPHFIFRSQSFAHGAQRIVDAETEEQWHQRISLFSSA